MELVIQPRRYGVGKSTESARRIGKVRLEQSVKLKKRLVIEADVVHVLGEKVGLLKAILNSLVGESPIMFASGKPFFLRSGDDLAIDHKGRSRIMVKGGNAKN